MKIRSSKKSVSASSTPKSDKGAKSVASDYIHKAIEALSLDNDSISKESIANLSVVLLDLSSSTTE